MRASSRSAVELRLGEKRRGLRSPPIASHARPAAPTPAAPPAPAPPVRTRSVVPWLHPLKSWSLRQSRGGSEPGERLLWLLPRRHLHAHQLLRRGQGRRLPPTTTYKTTTRHRIDP